jgi:aldose 1-epimerase
MLALRAADASLELAPELGGSILGWMLGRVRLLRHASRSAVVRGTVRETAGFPLVPYSNRIAHGHFRFAGTDYQLALNFGNSVHSIHGVGWQRTWLVSNATRDAATLTLHHAPDAGWPFAFSAEQRFHLTASTLHIALAVTNRHATPAPAGLGLHPYFPCGSALLTGAKAPLSRDDVTLRFHADAVWRNGLDHLPSERVGVPPEWDHSAGRMVGDAALDNCFEGWDGIAALTWSDRRMTIEATDSFRHLVVYTPPDQDFFCVEPVSHMNDAINRGGIRLLDPDATLRGDISFRLG